MPNRPRSGIARAALAFGLGGLCTALAGCVPPDYPEDPRLKDESGLTAPVILPLGDLIGQPIQTRDPENPDPGLQARGADLRKRADAVRAAGSDGL